MRRAFRGIYGFLPVQLVLLHLRKYQLLLVFWIILIATLTGNFAADFGAASLFLAPEYLGEINFLSMLLLGSAMAIFVMSWNMTTFIIHSHRIPFLGATRQAFLKYCINNSLVPIVFLIFFTTISVRFQLFYEHASLARTVLLQIGFYLGFTLLLLLSFFYFFRVDRNLFKEVLSRITSPSLIREIIPYDSLDVEFDVVRAKTYLSEKLVLRYISDLESYHPRLLSSVLRRHHRNAITATIFALALLLILGAFMEDPRLRIPAGAGFLLLFAIMMALVGAMKYFLKTWELMGWVLIVIFFSLLVKFKIFDLRSIAYGLDYYTPDAEKPVYDYAHLKDLFSPQVVKEDKQTGKQRLEHWRQKFDTAQGKPPLIVVAASGGGTRSAFWTFRALQYLDSMTGGKVFDHTVLVTGASGGMIGASYWRSVHAAHQKGDIENPLDPSFQENIGKDLLNAIIFSFASVDLISPFNKISIAGYSYSKDRGYAMEQELIRNTEGLLDRSIGYFRSLEATGRIPQMIINGTIVNDGRRLLISSWPVAHLTRSELSLSDSSKPPVDGVDFVRFFKGQNPLNLRLTTALRMNATFPYVLPVVRLPSQPEMNIMDAGLRDNFGMEVASRFLYVYRDWITENAGSVILLQVRDTRPYRVFPPTEQSSLISMIADPLMVIENKWAPFQSYGQEYLKDVLAKVIPNIEFVNMVYIPRVEGESAALNFHITGREKQDLYYSVYDERNQYSIQMIQKMLAK